MRILLPLLLFLQSCSADKVPIANYKAKNVIVVIMDGARYSETWGSPEHSLIPNMDSVMSGQGVVYTSFFNDGYTYTASGHVSITTGFNQPIDNTGAELPTYPSFFQLWLNESMSSPEKAWVITSKDKLEILANCKDSKWKNKFMPLTNCGINGAGVGSGYRDDSITTIEAINIMNEFEPNLVIINLREPDYSGHSGNWQLYSNAVRRSDEYVFQLWDFLQQHPKYKNSTAFFVTNDHGRHLDNLTGGFTGHGDDCEGCRHIFLFAAGPDFQKNKIVSKPRCLVDLNATIQEILRLKKRSTKGEIMRELFTN